MDDRDLRQLKEVLNVKIKESQEADDLLEMAKNQKEDPFKIRILKAKADLKHMKLENIEKRIAERENWIKEQQRQYAAEKQEQKI